MKCHIHGCPTQATHICKFHHAEKYRLVTSMRFVAYCTACAYYRDGVHSALNLGSMLELNEAERTLLLLFKDDFENTEEGQKYLANLYRTYSNDK